MYQVVLLVDLLVHHLEAVFDVALIREYIGAHLIQLVVYLVHFGMRHVVLAQLFNVRLNDPRLVLVLIM